MKDVYVADLAGFENQAIVSFFAVASKQLRGRKDGGRYLALTLCDRTGQVECRMWENFEGCVDGFQPGDVVKVRGEVSRYNARFQLTLDKVRRAAADEIDLADYVPRTQFDIDGMWSELNRYVESFSNPHLKALLRSFLDDQEIAKAMRQAPAAKSLHHAWLGGLLEHIISLLGICDLAARHYREIDRDLLLVGAILHDVGKIEELSWGTSFEYTLRGQLLGHIAIGVAMIECKLRALPGFPSQLRLLVEHLVLSHHGKLEFGSPKLPMIPEAVMLHYLDDLDAKMQTISNEFERHSAQGRPAAEMTDWVRSLDRQLLRSAALLTPEAESPKEE